VLWLFLVLLPIAVDAAASPTLINGDALIVEDFKYDDGENLGLTWVPSIDDQPSIGRVTGYQVCQIAHDGAPVKIADLLPDRTTTGCRISATGLSILCGDPGRR
jgi:hypothetical protein